MAELTTLARPYARAAFEVAKSDNALAQWADALNLLEAVTADSKVQHLLDSPSLTAELKSDALVSLLGDKVDVKLKNFISTLADNKRLDLLPTIKELFAELKALQEKVVEVEVTTAFDIPPATQKALITALTRKLEREVSLTTTVDASLIGGALIRAGDTVIDGSVKGRLTKLAETMIS